MDKCISPIFFSFWYTCHQFPIFNKWVLYYPDWNIYKHYRNSIIALRHHFKCWKYNFVKYIVKWQFCQMTFFFDHSHSLIKKRREIGRVLHDSRLVGKAIKLNFKFQLNIANIFPLFGILKWELNTHVYTYVCI